MDNLAAKLVNEDFATAGAERRGSQRFTSLIRAAKVVCESGQFVCVIRDVSATGIGLRTFHSLPEGEKFVLVLQNGEEYPLKPVRIMDSTSSFTFDTQVDVQRLIVEASKFPKRQLRIGFEVPVKISTQTQSWSGIVRNMSQQGAMIECDARFAIEQPIGLEIDRMPELRAKVRWRQGEEYGTAFDTTFTLGEFARNVAALQSPRLLG